MSDVPCRAGSDPEEELHLAEERFLLRTQMEMQRLLNEKGLRYRDLARRLGVSEARVSQIFGDEAGNLTVRTVARIFHRLGEEPRLIAARELERQLAAARGANDPSPAWTVAGTDDVFDLDGSATSGAVAAPSREPSQRTSWADWVSAERAWKAPRADAA